MYPKPTARASRLALLVLPLLLVLTVSTVRADAVATVLPPDGLHLRVVPATQGRSLGVIPGGARIALTGNAADGWYPVVWNNQRGHVRADFLDVPSDADTTPRKAMVRAMGGLVLREEPIRTAKPLITMPNGAAISVSTRTTSDNWVLVAFEGHTGWASATYVQFEGATAPGPLATSPGASTPASIIGPTLTGRSTITYYHPSLEGGPMACGGRYRAEDPTIAAATSWPCGTKLRVCRNSVCVQVTVQDTGLMGPNWVDLSAAAFRQLAPLPEMMVFGTIEVIP